MDPAPRFRQLIAVLEHHPESASQLLPGQPLIFHEERRPIFVAQ
jgi:hypothetical protein